MGKIIISERKHKAFKLTVTLLIILILLAAVSTAWFTFVRESKLDGSSFSSADSDFELASCSTEGIYDSRLMMNDVRVLAVGDEKTYTVNNSDIALYSTGSTTNNEVSWMMTPDSGLGNLNGTEAVKPGSSGKLAFYVIPKISGSLKFRFSLSMDIFSSDYISDKPSDSEYILSSGNGSDVYYACFNRNSTEYESLYKLAEGHIMFFENKNGDFYENRIYDYTGCEISFERNLASAVADTPELVEIYWVWPDVLGSVLLPENDRNLGTYRSLFADSSTDKSGIAADMTDAAGKKYEYYFYNFSGYDNLPGIITDSTSGSVNEFMSGNYDIDDFAVFSTAWNRADQSIGLNAGYIKLSLSAVRIS